MISLLSSSSSSSNSGKGNFKMAAIPPKLDNSLKKLNVI